MAFGRVKLGNLSPSESVFLRQLHPYLSSPFRIFTFCSQQRLTWMLATLESGLTSAGE